MISILKKDNTINLKLARKINLPCKRLQRKIIACCDNHSVEYTSSYLNPGKRPAWVIDVIDYQYQRAKEATMYIHVGASSFTALSALGITCNYISSNYLKAGDSVLDIGTGDGSLLDAAKNQHPDIRAYGISAFGYLGKYYPSQSENNYFIHNAQNLSDLPPIKNGQKFNVISSTVTFCHLADPLGTLVQAYDALEDDGILMIDDFDLSDKGINGTQLIGCLEGNGYEIAAFSWSGNIQFLYIRKTEGKPTLRLPIAYGINNQKIYQALPELLKFPKEDLGTKINQYIIEDLSDAREAEKLIIRSAGISQYVNKTADMERHPLFANISPERQNRMRTIIKKVENLCNPEREEQEEILRGWGLKVEQSRCDY